MKIYIISALISILSINLSHAESLWGLNSETESRLTAALELQRASKTSLQSKAGMSFVTVGSDGACDFRVGQTKIQLAVDSGASEIRIAYNDTYEENILISNPSISLTLRGGFADCSDAANNIQSSDTADYTEITRTNGVFGGVFLINALPPGNITTFENMRIIGGDGQNATSGGSIRLTSTDSDVILNNVWLTQGFNNPTGGGLSVFNSNTTIILNNSAIFENSASQGGGIFCYDFSGLGKRATIILADDSRLNDNSSVVNGGGAFISKGCLLASFAGNSTGDRTVGIFDNASDGDGGGIYAENSANVLIYGHTLCLLSGGCFGNTTSPSSVNFNSANDDYLTVNSGNESGGAIYATGESTDVTIVAGYLISNSTNGGSGGGGAIAVLDTATLNVSHPGLGCWSTDKCNLFKGNTASIGGAIFSQETTVNVTHTFFELNRANLGLVVFSLAGSTTIEGSVIAENGNDSVTRYDDDYLLYAFRGNVLNVRHSTITNNYAETAVINVSTDPGTKLNLNSSIIHDQNTGNVINSGAGIVNSNCNITHEVASLTGTNNFVDDPEFVDPIQGDYHLLASSPAIDLCDQTWSIENRDIDLQHKGYDVLSINNVLGPYDAGADEFYDKTYLTVGGDAACDFNTTTQSVQNAVDTGIGEVRIASNGVHNQITSIENRNVKLRGGYADCNAADNDVQSTSTDIVIAEGSQEPAIAIAGDNQRNSILIENLNLTGKDRSALFIINANADVLLKNVTIQNTHSELGFFGAGGGIFMLLSTVNLNMVDTLITQNSGPQGGGIYCNGSSSIVMSGNSGLSQNTTTGKGGGAYITGGCEFTMYSGTSNPTAQSTIGISANIADEEGGGIYVDSGGKIILNGHEDCSQECIGDNINPVSVNHNKSNGGASGGERGGGIYMTGSGTSVNIYAGLFSENQSPNGGAIYVNDFANLTIERLSKDCWDLVKCNYFLKNRALGAGTGGAIQNDQGFLKISSAYFEENDGRSGSVLYAFGSNSHNTFESSVFNHNNNKGTVDKYVIRAAASASVEISHSTFSDNYITNSTVFGIALDSELKLLSSIVHETQGDVLDVNPGTTVIDCVMAHETTSFTGTNIFLDDPEFVDRNNRDYHLNMSSSPAIDVCDDSMVNIQFKDIDFDGRGIDDVNVSNVNGPYDIGADESRLNLDFMFADGFE